MKKYILFSLLGLVGSVYAVKKQHYICNGKFQLSQSMGAQSTRRAKKLTIGVASLEVIRSNFNFCSPEEEQQACSIADQSGSDTFLIIQVKNANRSSGRQAPKKALPVSTGALNAYARDCLSENVRVCVAAVQKLKRRAAKIEDKTIGSNKKVRRFSSRREENKPGKSRNQKAKRFEKIHPKFYSENL